MTAPAVNLLWCVPGVVGGSEQYLVRQLLGLVELGIEHQRRPVLCCLGSFADAHPELTSQFRVRVAPMPGAARPLRIAAEHTWLVAATRSACVVHHGGGTVPAVGRRPVVLTIHDLQYRDLPANFGAVRRRYLEWAMPRSVRRADSIAVPSRFVAGTVVNAFDVDPASIVIVPHGVPHRPAWDGDDTALRRRVGIGPEPFAVYPAITHPHKGHRFLVELFGSGLVDPELRLVLIGGRGAAEDELRNAIGAARLGDRILRLGRVGDPDRDGLLAAADVVLFPSSYEGFGAPIVEAMAAGTPVVCSDQGALPEIAGDAALVTSLDVDAWAAAIERARRDPAPLVAAGRRRLAAFRLARSGAAMWRSYALAIERHGAGGGDRP